MFNLNRIVVHMTPKLSCDGGKCESQPLEERSSSMSNSNKKSCIAVKKNLKVCNDSVSNSNCIRVYTRTLRPNECLKNSRKLGPNFPSLFKKARTSQLRRPTANFDNFVTQDCVTPTPEPSEAPFGLERRPCLLHWVIRKKRTKNKSIIKSDLLSHVKDCPKLLFFEDFLRLSHSIKTQACVEVQVQELMKDNDSIIHETIRNADFEMLDAFDDEEEEENQCYDFYKEAVFDFSIQMIDSLHIDDGSNGFSSQMVDGLHRKRNDVSNDFSGRMIDDVSNQLILWNQNQNGAIVVSKDKTVSSEESQPPPNAKAKAEKPPKAKAKKGIKDKAKTKKKAPKTEEVDEEQLKKFESAMKLEKGEEWHFSPPCEGSVVDYAVGLFLNQRCNDLNLTSSDAFVAFKNLRSRFRVASGGVTDYAIQDTEVLSIAEGPFDEVVPEQLPMVGKEGPSCSTSSHTQVDSEDGNVNLSQTELNLGERKEKNCDKQDTSHWGELCVKKTTPKNRTSCNRDSIDWDAVRQTSYSDLAVILMKRSQRYLLGGIIKDFLNRMVKDHGSIDLEWMRDIPPEEANEHLLRIPCLQLKKTESTAATD